MISRCFEPHLNIYIDSQDRYNIYIFIILCFYLIRFNEVLEKLVVHDSRRASTPEPIKTLKDAYCPITVLEHGSHLNVREPYVSKTTRFFKIFTVLDKITYFFFSHSEHQKKNKKDVCRRVFFGSSLWIDCRSNGSENFILTLYCHDFLFVLSFSSNVLLKKTDSTAFCLRVSQMS